jgi:phage FluMu gp28-like protein
MVAPAAPGTAPLGIVKRDEAEFRQWLATERGFLTAFGKFSDEDLKFEPYQTRFLADQSHYRCVEKSRQVGYSFLFACEAMARSHLRDIQNSIFVSYNLADAKEKIAYCQQLHEELPLDYQKRRVIDSKLEIGFRSNSSAGRVSRIISNPSKAPRGKKGDIYLDELAHCANDREIYKGSTALILRSRGQLTVCSSPLGRRGQFWEIARQEIKPFKYYRRQAVPWWLCSFFANDVPTAAIEAPKLDTAERVERFGTVGIQEQFGSLLLEDFQQEFEVNYSDESYSFFPYELILPAMKDLELSESFADLADAKGRLTAGFDVGRRRDASALEVVEENNGVKRSRFSREYDRVTFQAQESDLRALLQVAPIARLSIDNSGLGMQMAENLERDFPGVVERQEFTNTTKELMCTDFKISLQRGTYEGPRDRTLISQIHSIKRHVTGAGRVTFDASRDSKGHADRFWALVMACKKERGGVTPGGVGVRIIG